MKKYFITITLFILSQWSIHGQTNYSDLSWPREITAEGYSITLYQPQLESFEGNQLDSRMAVSISNKKDLIFGAVWLKGKVSTDLDSRIVHLENIEIPKINFPDISNEDKTIKLSALLKKEIESWDLEMSLDHLIASMNEIENTKNLSDQINNNPPDIYYRTSPTVLISIDGDPFYKTDEEFDLSYVVNTPSLIVKSKDSYYIKEGKFWYRSEEVLSNYSSIDSAPKNIAAFSDKYGKDIVLDSFQLAMDKAPELIVVTKASELISTDGEPDYQTIQGSSLLYAKNTEDDILLDINSQEHYILLAGRWYHSKNLKDGSWEFADPDALPEDFAKIPKESDMANVRASVPNTEEAQDALLAQSIPQTAKVDRKTASVEVSYDGNPTFEKIEGTSISYAVNTDKTVLEINKKYYCVDDAIWFVSDKATGPWTVSVERPEEVDSIPADSPVYNVKYVYIYESTPEIVYVGYYPGYTYSYVYHGVVVYGTGYHYPYWYGSVYYPRPVTYGYGVHYNPYTGWGFTVGISVGWGYHPYGCWGPAGYHYGYRSGYNRGYQHGYYNGYNRGYNQGAKAGYAAGKRSNNTNLYADRKQGIKESNANRGNNKGTYETKSRPSTKQNNLYTDKNGAVFEQKKDGSWENKTNAASNAKANVNNRQSKTPSNMNKGVSNKGVSNKGIESTKPATKQNTRSNPSQQQLNQAAQNRSRGAQNYNRSSSYQRSGSTNRGGGGATRGTGGGVRRR